MRPSTLSCTSASNRSDVVVELVGELERGARVLERRREPLPEACRPGEAAVDARLERRLRRRLAQRLLEQRDGAVDALELGEEDESLGAQRADLGLGQQVGRDRAGARPLPGGVMRTRRGERSPMALVARLRRRQPERLLGELGRDRRRAAIGREPRGVVEHSGDVGVGRVRRRARGDGRGGAGRRRCSRDPRVNAPPLVAQVRRRGPTTAADA